MIRQQTLVCFAFALLLSVQSGCKSSTAPDDNGGGTGTIVFGESIDEVALATLGSNVSSVAFQGTNPSWTNSGKIVYELWGSYNTDGKEHIMLANPDGTGRQVLVNMQEYNSSIYANPHMSPDGKYVSFNYHDDVYYKLGPTLGTLIYDATTGAQVVALDNTWDGSWAPDGSIVVSGTVFSLDNHSANTIKYEGLYRYAIGATVLQQIGAPGQLTAPWYPSVSPDGSKVAFAMNNHIWTIHMDGTGLKQITTGPNEETFSTWSPDGASIACVSAGDIGLTSGNALAIVPSDPAAPTTVSQSASVWVKDDNNTVGLLNPIGSVSWK